LLGALQDGIDALEENPTAITASGADSPLADANGEAKELGMKKCGE